MKPLMVHLIQADLAWRDPAANRRRLEDVLTGLHSGGQLAVLPEMFTSGFTMEPEGVAEDMGGATLDWLSRMAGHTGLVICGSLPVRSGAHFYNRLVWMRPDGSYTCYDKRHLFRMAGEHRHYASGRERLVVDLDGWRICPLVCYDLRFPVFSYGSNAFDLQLFVANWPAARQGAWQALLPARAIENQCYVAGVNRVGRDGIDVEYSGASAAYDFLGRPLAVAGNEESVLSLSLDGAALERYREKFPAWRDADRFRLLD